MLMAHSEYGFHHIPDSIAEEAAKDGWFAVVDLASAKARINGLEVVTEPVVHEEPKKRGRPAKAK